MMRHANRSAEVDSFLKKSEERREELDRLIASPEGKAAKAEWLAEIERTPLLAVKLRNALYSLMPSDRKRDAEAIGVLIDRMEVLLDEEPALKASKGVSAAIRQVITALEEVDIFNASYFGVVAAFANPSTSFINRLNASQPRLPDQMKEAAELFDKWAENPDLYKNRAAFKRDVQAKELCLDGGTADRWLKIFIELLEQGSPLAVKLSKK